eukprot:jgi/Botrbrau1/104/Bobra.0022s0093.1
MPSRKQPQKVTRNFCDGRCIGEDSIVHKTPTTLIGPANAIFCGNYSQSRPYYGACAAAVLNGERQLQLERKQASLQGLHSRIMERIKTDTMRHDLLWEREAMRQSCLQSSNIAKRNKSGESFDIITLQYHNSANGRQLQAEDDQVKSSCGTADKGVGHGHSIPWHMT